MVKVYFESKVHAELVAILDSEELYDKLYPVLEAIAKDARMFVTESVEEESIDDLIKEV
jgi:hypothetical protein